MDVTNTAAGACLEPRDASRSDAAHHLRRLAPLLLLAWVLLNWGWTTSFGFNNDDFVWIHTADLSIGTRSAMRTLGLPIAEL
jgi:hypothetical protein